MEIPQKTKNRITIWSGNHTPGHISRQKSNSKRYLHPCVHSRTIHNSQDLKTTWISIDRLMGKEDMVHIYNGILLSHKKEWNNTICSNMDGPRGYHTKWKSARVFTLVDFILGLWSILSQYLYMVCDRGHNSFFFGMWILMCPSTICQKDYLFFLH